MTRRSPTSALFPYTTLFRSLGRKAKAVAALERLDVRHDPHLPRPVELLEFLDDLAEATQVPLEFRPVADGLIVEPDLRGFGDRKSTRLNSSHRCISYAVFCL